MSSMRICRVRAAVGAGVAQDPLGMRTWLGAGSFTEAAPTIAAPRQRLTDRAGRWATVQAGRRGRPASDVADELDAGWDTVMDAVVAYGQGLIDDPHRFADVEALGLDETVQCKIGRWRRQRWSMQNVDVDRGQQLDVVAGRDSTGAAKWLASRPEAWRDGIAWVLWTCRAHIARCSTQCCPTRSRSRTHFTFIGSPPNVSMSAAGGSRTKRWGIVATKTIRSIERGDFSPGLMTVSMTRAAPSCWDCSDTASAREWSAKTLP